MVIKRNLYLSCRLSEQERHALVVLANREGLPISDLTRTLIREGLEARGVKTVGLLDLLFEEVEEDVQDDQPRQS
jgi:hypothetical protein